MFRLELLVIPTYWNSGQSEEERLTQLYTYITCQLRMSTYMYAYTCITELLDSMCRDGADTSKVASNYKIVRIQIMCSMSVHDNTLKYTARVTVKW